MKQIKTIDGHVVTVDDEDYSNISKFKWRTITPRNITYATTKICHKTWYMHRMVLKTPFTMHTDHIDGNGLNNQKKNLRVVTCRGNQHNRRSHTSSKYPGVTWHSKLKKWQAQIEIDKRTVYLGVYDDEFEASRVYTVALAVLIK